MDLDFYITYIDSPSREERLDLIKNFGELARFAFISRGSTVSNILYWGA